MEPFQHTITALELQDHPGLFHSGALEGEQVELTDAQYEALGLELHALTNDDLIESPHYARLGLIAGDVIERPIPTIEINEEETPGE